MADPARNIDPVSDSEADYKPQNFEIKQHATQSIQSGSLPPASTIGPSIAVNDNAVVNDGDALASGQKSTAISSPAQNGANVPQPTQTTGSSPIASAAKDNPAPQQPTEKTTPNQVEPKPSETAASSSTKDTGATEENNKSAPQTTQENEAQPNQPAQAPSKEDKTEATKTEVGAANTDNNDKNITVAPAQAQPENSSNAPAIQAQRPMPGRRNPLRPNTAVRPRIPQSNGSVSPTVNNNRQSTAPTSNQAATNPKQGSSTEGLAQKAVSKAQSGMHKMAERQEADEKSGKAETDKMTQGPGIDAKKSGSLAASVANDANIEKRAAEAAARRAGAIAGGLGASKKTQQNITVSLITLINIVFLILEVASGIGVLLFIAHIVLFLYWLFTEDRWKHSWMALVAVLLSPFMGVFGVIAGFCMLILGGSFIACHYTAESIPFGIPISYVTSIGSVFGANFGPFAQICDHLNVHSAGVGGVRNTTARNTTPATTGGTTQAIGMINGQVVLVDENGQTLTPIIPNTQLVRPQPLAPELASQSNQAGYLSPASCKLGEIPYSDEVITRSVRLDNGQTKLVAFPIHKTIDCIKNDPSKVAVRSVQLGKVVRLVDDDSVLGKYVSVEYPNGLRVSYYHLAQIAENLALGSVVNAGQPLGTMGNSGQISFEGTQMLFELKDSSGSWKIFNPINPNADISVLTTFPCADNPSAKCLLE